MKNAAAFLSYGLIAVFQMTETDTSVNYSKKKKKSL